MNDAKNAFRAGLVIVVGVAVAIFFFASARKSTLDADNSVGYVAFLTDASGINAKSLITIAGLQVGEITNISLVPTTIGELVVDYEDRFKLIFDPTTQVIVEKNDEFDAIIRRLHEKAAPKNLDEAIALRGEPIRVAKVTMRVTGDVKVPVDTWVRKESLGLLGSKALFLELGRSTTMLGEGGRIINVRSMTGTDALLAAAEGIVTDVRSITKKIDNDVGGITSDIRGITSQLNRFINGDGDTPPLDELYKLAMGDLRRLTNTIDSVLKDAQVLIRDNDQEFKKLVANVTRISGDIADLTAAGTNTPPTPLLDAAGKPVIGTDGQPVMVMNEGDIRATMRSVRQIADDLTSVTRQLKTALGDNGDKVADGVTQLQETVTELNRTLVSLSEVAGRVERGEGTVGRLLTDENMAQKVEDAVNGAADFVTGLTSLETHVDVGSWYKLQPRAHDDDVVAEAAAEARQILPRRDRRRRRQPRALDHHRRRQRGQHDPQLDPRRRQPDPHHGDVCEAVLRLPRVARGLDRDHRRRRRQHLPVENSLEIRSDLFGTRGPRDSLVTDINGAWYLPRWRTMLKAQPIPHLYVSAGIDDLLNAYSFERKDLRIYNRLDGYGLDWYLGVGLTFKDDDLRSILPFIPGG